MRRELSLRGFCWVEAIHSHFPFTLPKTHYCGIGYRAKCNLFCPVLCLIKKMPHLFAIISFLVYAINTDVVFLRPYWKSTVLGRNPCPAIHQQAQKTCSLLLSAVQSLNSVSLTLFLEECSAPSTYIALALTSPTSYALNLPLTLKFPVPSFFFFFFYLAGEKYATDQRITL